METSTARYISEAYSAAINFVGGLSAVENMRELAHQCHAYMFDHLMMPYLRTMLMIHITDAEDGELNSFQQGMSGVMGYVSPAQRKIVHELSHLDLPTQRILINICPLATGVKRYGHNNTQGTPHQNSVSLETPISLTTVLAHECEESDKAYMELSEETRTMIDNRIRTCAEYGKLELRE